MSKNQNKVQKYKIDDNLSILILVMLVFGVTYFILGNNVYKSNIIDCNTNTCLVIPLTTDAMGTESLMSLSSLLSNLSNRN
jgi:uncharacterized membrane protein